MRLRGRIDRIDTLETEDKVYVKIVDYKSGNTTFSLLNLYHGLQLQLVVYLNAALELVARANPGRVAEPQHFYYRIEDPIVEGSGTESEEEIRQAIFRTRLFAREALSMREEIYRAMDEDFSGNLCGHSGCPKGGRLVEGSIKDGEHRGFLCDVRPCESMITAQRVCNVWCVSYDCK